MNKMRQAMEILAKDCRRRLPELVQPISEM